MTNQTPKIISDRSNARKAAHRATEKSGQPHVVAPAPDGAKGFIIVLAPLDGDEVPPKALDIAPAAASYPPIGEYADLELPEDANPEPIDPPQIFDAAQTIFGGMEDAVADLAAAQAQRIGEEGESFGAEAFEEDAGQSMEAIEARQAERRAAQPPNQAAAQEDAGAEEKAEAADGTAEDFNVTLVFSCTREQARMMADLVARKLGVLVQGAVGEDYPPTRFGFSADGTAKRAPRTSRRGGPGGGVRPAPLEKPVILSPTNQSAARLVDRIEASRGDLAALRRFDFKPNSTYYAKAHLYLSALIAEAEQASAT